MAKVKATLDQLNAAAIAAVCDAAFVESAAAAIAGTLTMDGGRSTKDEESIDPRQSKIDNQRPRFRMLRNIYKLSRQNLTDAKIAERLGMEPAAFETLKKTDADAMAAYRQARIDAETELMEILWDRARDGNSAIARQLLAAFDAAQEKKGLDPKRVPIRTFCRQMGRTPDQVDYWYRKHAMPKNIDGTVDLAEFVRWFEQYTIRQHSFDPNHVKQIDLEPYLGVTRQTVAAWTAAGMPKNADGTYSLAQVFNWRIDQLGSGPAKAGEAVNPLTQIKAEKLQLEVDAARGKLVDRVSVETGLIARAQTLAAFIDRKGPELPTLLANLTAEKIKGVLDEFFEALRAAAAVVPDDIAGVLDGHRREKLAAFLAELVHWDEGD